MGQNCTSHNQLQQQFELVVSPGKRHIAERVVAAMFFTLALFELYQLALLFFKFGFSEAICMHATRELKSVFTFIAGGVSFSITKTVLIDLHKDKLISRFEVGPFSRDRISSVPNLEYIAVFLNPKEYYEVNLWYKGNKHYKMYRFVNESDAMAFANLAAKRLKLDLLDKTVKGKSRWIEYKTG